MNFLMKPFWTVLLLGLFISPATASDAVNQRYINQLTKGGMVSIKQAAQSIYNTSLRDTEVLDVAAEVLLQRYPIASHGDIDSLAWLCRALGNSLNSRYYTTLNEVTNNPNTNKKLRKYAKKALNQLGGENGEQYTKGTIDLATVGSSAKKTGPAKEAVAPAQNGKQNLDIVREGMSREEVLSLIGHPTASVSHQTGKAFNPFNFKGGDVVRTIDLYKGKGRVVYSNTNAYTSTMRVLEVLVDPLETGYP